MNRCAKCRDRKHWTKAEDVNGDGVLWHWYKSGRKVTVLAKRCMRQRTRWNGFKWILSSDSGQAIAEFAVLLPVFVFVSFVLIDIQWMTRTAAALEYVVTETARCEAIESKACAPPSSPQGYATQLAQNIRLSTGTNFDLDTPPCGPNTCQVSIVYHYKPLGAWFPALTISRTGSAAVPPAVTP